MTRYVHVRNVDTADTAIPPPGGAPSRPFMTYPATPARCARAG